MKPEGCVRLPEQALLPERTRLSVAVLETRKINMVARKLNRPNF